MKIPEDSYEDILHGLMDIFPHVHCDVCGAELIDTYYHVNHENLCEYCFRSEYESDAENDLFCDSCCDYLEDLSYHINGRVLCESCVQYKFIRTIKGKYA